MPRCLHTVLAWGLAALAAAGCGGSPPAAGRAAAPTPPGPCTAAARAVIAGEAGTRPELVSTRASTAPSGAFECAFAAAPPGGGRSIGVLAAIDTAPQAYARFDREAVEYSQNVIWAHQGAGRYPQYVGGLGMGADWFPAERRLLTTDGTRLVAVTVTWPGASARRQHGLAEAVARLYLSGPA